jgi:hypothetical protein
MGYRTHFELQVTSPTDENLVPDEVVVIKALSKLEPEIFISCFIDERSEITDFLYGSRTWDTHEDTLKKISLQFKDTLFTLHGEGEHPADIWNKYFFNGEVFVARAKFYIPTFKDVYNKAKEV